MMESKLRQMVKFQDFEQNPYLINISIDLVAIVAKIGELKYASEVANKNEDKAEPLPIRELQIYDDTFTMVRLILRSDLAENCEHFIAIDDVVALKNVKIVKIQNRFVITTSKDTVINVNTAAYEVLWLKQWFLYNRKDILRNNFAQFNNLSMTPAKLKKEREKDIASSTPSECPPAKLSRLSSNTVNALEKKSDDSRVDPLLLSPSSPMDPKDLVDYNNVSSSESQENTQSGFIHTISDDENDMKTNNQKEKKRKNEEVRETKANEVEKEKHILEKVEKEANEPDEVKKDIKFETYHTLMQSLYLENDWNEEKDQYLVNFITKNSYNLQNDLVYTKLLFEMPDVFAQATPAMLKERVSVLSSVKNYLYLMKLCGGEHLTTENEKSTFLVKVEKLRESMKLKETS